MGVVHKADPSWATHIPPLLLAFELTRGPVLELGMGMMSTPLLHILCEATDRYMTSYDNDGRFVDMFSRFRNPNHEIELVDFDELNVGGDWSVVLVDHKPAARRKEDIKNLAGSEYLIVHDTQERADEFYGFDEIYPLFKYRYDYNKFDNRTTVLSNKHELDFFHSALDK